MFTTGVSLGAVLRRMLSSWKNPKPVPGSGMFHTNFRRTLWPAKALRSTTAGRVVPDAAGRVVGVFFNGQVRRDENRLVEQCRSASGRLDFHAEGAVLGGAEPEQLPCRPVIELERRGARRQRDVLIQLTAVDELVRAARRRVVAVEIVQRGPHSVGGLRS